ELVDKGVKSYQSIVRKTITPTKSLKTQMTKAAFLSPIKVPMQQYDLSGSRNEKPHKRINTTSGSRNLTQDKLAKDFEISQSTVSVILSESNKWPSVDETVSTSQFKKNRQANWPQLEEL
ncbi:17076_t:CDS:2, partial [Entrophospora sp. SA101]